MNLYLRLKSAAADETMLVLIVPAFVETQAIKDQLEALKVKYPDYIYEIDSRWWASSYDAPPYYGMPAREPYETSGSRGGASLPSTGVAQDQPAATILPLPLPILDTGKTPDTGTGVTDNDQYRQKYMAFKDELHAIMAQGYAAQQSAIEAALTDMGVASSRSEYSFSLYAELTA
ncbi:MAG: hypothetical protein AB1497_10105 [Bacillota bacterium]